MSNPREENAKKAARRRFEARELLQRLKSGPCMDCGNKFHHCQMDLVRKDESDKPPMSKMLLRSKEAIVDDVEGCDLVCANCGRMRTWNRQRARRAGAT